MMTFAFYLLSQFFPLRSTYINSPQKIARTFHECQMNISRKYLPLSLQEKMPFFSRHGRKEKRSQKNKVSEGDLFSNVKCLLVVGKLIFLLPCQGLSWKTHHNYEFRRNSFATAMCLLIITWCIVKDLVGLKFFLQISHGGAVGYAHPAHYVLISSVLTFIYLYFFTNSGKLKKLFERWDTVAANFHLNSLSFRHLSWVAVIPLILPFITNALFSIDGVCRLDGQVRLIPTNVTRLEYLYSRLLQHWHAIISFSEAFTLFCALDFVFASLPRAFVISCIVVFSVALSSQFKMLLEAGLAKINSDEAKKPVYDGEDQTFWTGLVGKHNVLTDLVAEFDDFLSPLIFITYLTSLYLICMQLLRALSTSTGQSGAELTLGLSPFIYNISFCVEVFLLYYMATTAAQLNDYAHRIGTVLRKCPSEYQTSEIIRLENRVNNGPQIGFTGLGCFVITKPHLLTVAKTVVTLEIALLQAQVANPITGMGN